MEESFSDEMSAPSPPSDRMAANGCRKRGGPMSPKSSGDSLRNLTQHEEFANLGLRMDEPTSTGWTNEKHSLYLHSMEASFVRQLYNHTNSSMDVLPCKQYNAGSHISSGQFKVLRDGCWQKASSERDQPKLSTAGESHVVLKSRWIEHYMSPLKCKETRSPHQKRKGELGTETMHFRQWRRHCNELAENSKQPLSCHTQLCHQDPITSSSEEVTDQNFVDEGHEEERLRSLYGEKRMKADVADVSSKYQVVPSGKFPLAVDSKDKSAFTGGDREVQNYRS